MGAFADWTTSNLSMHSIFLKGKGKAIDSTPDTGLGGSDSDCLSVQFQPESCMSGSRQVTHALGFWSFSLCVGEKYTPLPSCLKMQGLKKKKKKVPGLLLNHAPVPCRDCLTTSEGRAQQAHLQAGTDPG